MKLSEQLIMAVNENLPSTYRTLEKHGWKKNVYGTFSHAKHPGHEIGVGVTHLTHEYGGETQHRFLHKDVDDYLTKMPKHRS